MKKFVLPLFAALSILTVGLAAAQTQYLPMPSGVGTAGQTLRFTDANNAQGSDSLRVGASGTGTTLTQIVVYSQTLTPTVVTAGLCENQTFTVTGLTTADDIVLNAPAPTDTESNGIAISSYRVSAADTLQVTYCNLAATNESPQAGTNVAIAIRS